MSGCYCKSLYPFSGDQHQQGLTFEAGDRIKIVQALPGGWWEGEKDGATGWFPSSYVQVLELPMEDLKEPLPPQWRCYMSPQGRRYYVNTSSNERERERERGCGVREGTAWQKVAAGRECVGMMSESEDAVPNEWLLLSSQNPGSVSPTRKQSKETTVTINCVTFPLPMSMAEQPLLKPDEWSYCDYFWMDKKEPQGAAGVSGFEVLLQKQLKGKQMQKEMAEFVRESTLGKAWAQLKKSLADEAEVHLKFSSKLQSEVEKPLLSFRDNFKKDMKRFDHHIADLRKQLIGRYAAVEKARRALADRQKDLEVKSQQLELKLSNKTEEDIKKARRKSTQAGDELMRCVDLYNQSQSKWFEEMVTTSLELERLEVERIEMIRQHLCQYTTLRHETDMFNQSTMEPVDQLLQGVDPGRDRELWVNENQTGEIRPVDIEI
uniref:Growth arrest specific 7 n=1 Tax=Gadus morhua TaxID=8049 RepID=A0A8C5AMI4_GADMO